MAFAIIAKKTPPEIKDKELTPILDELSHDPDIKLDLMKSLIIVCDAFKMFPEYFIWSSITTLTPDKRQRLIEFVSLTENPLPNIMIVLLSEVLCPPFSLIILLDVQHSIWGLYKQF